MITCWNDNILGLLHSVKYITEVNFTCFIFIICLLEHLNAPQGPPLWLVGWVCWRARPLTMYCCLPRPAGGCRRGVEVRPSEALAVLFWWRKKFPIFQSVLWHIRLYNNSFKILNQLKLVQCFLKYGRGYAIKKKIKWLEFIFYEELCFVFNFLALILSSSC